MPLESPAIPGDHHSFAGVSVIGFKQLVLIVFFYCCVEFIFRHHVTSTNEYLQFVLNLQSSSVWRKKPRVVSGKAEEEVLVHVPQGKLFEAQFKVRLTRSVNQRAGFAMEIAGFAESSLSGQGERGLKLNLGCQ